MRDMDSGVFITPPDAIAVSGSFDMRKAYEDAAYRAEFFELTHEQLKDLGIALLNGQHRVKARIDSITPEEITSLFVTGYEISDQRVMDQGQARKLQDVISLEGRGSTHLGPLLNYLWREQNGVPLFGYHSGRTPTNSEALALLDEFPRLHHTLKVGAAVKKKLRVSAPMASVLYFRMSEADVDKAREFWRLLITGSNLEAGTPVYRARETLISNAAHKHQAVDQKYVRAVIISAWNAWSRDKARVTPAVDVKNPDTLNPPLWLPADGKAAQPDDDEHAWW
jgi:hypothetical protein